MITVVNGHWQNRETDVQICVLAKPPSCPLKVGEFRVDPITAAIEERFVASFIYFILRKIK